MPRSGRKKKCACAPSRKNSTPLRWRRAFRNISKQSTRCDGRLNKSQSGLIYNCFGSGRRAKARSTAPTENNCRLLARDSREDFRQSLSNPMGNTHYDATNVKIRNSRVTLTFDARRGAGSIQRNSTEKHCQKMAAEK